MKYEYKTPEIMVEELTRSDVLCESGPVDNHTTNQSGFDGYGNAF